MDKIVSLVAALSMLVVLISLIIMLMRRLVVKPMAFMEKDYGLQPRVSILMSCFNEGKNVLRTVESVLANDYPKDKIEIVAIDDCSADDTYAWLEQAAKQWPNVRALKNPINTGKTVSIFNALRYSTGEVVVVVDSDCIIDRCAITELVSCLGDEQVGAVGGMIAINNPHENIITQCQVLSYYIGFGGKKMAQSRAKSTIIILGALFAIRREIFESIEAEMKSRKWLGIRVRDGEDRYMTHLLLLKGFKACINANALCWTDVPNSFRQLFMQQLRWRRSTLRDLLWTFWHFKKNIIILNPLLFINYFGRSVLFVVFPFMCLYAVVSGNFLQHLWMVFPYYCGAGVLGGAFFNVFVNHLYPGRKIRLPTLGILGLWLTLDICFITLVALCTFDVGDWGTRDVTASGEDASSPSA